MKETEKAEIVWYDIKRVLPNIDQLVLFIGEDGCIWEGFIDKDVENINDFINNRYAPLVAWCESPQVPEFK